MATKKSQRIGIWIISGAMLLGTVGGFIVMMVAPGNQAKEQAELDAEMKQWNEATSKWQAKVDEIRAGYYPEFKNYTSQVGEFNASDVKELTTSDLKVGDGEEIKDNTKIEVYYIGWNPKGEIFDQSIDDGKLKEPFLVDGPAKTSVIAGWKEGLIGMKIGGVRLLTIPADKAYGEQGSGDKIPANTPLKFVVMAVAPAPERPAAPPLVKKQYKEQYGIDI